MIEDILDEQLGHRDAPWYPVLGDDGVVEHLAFMARIYDYDPVPTLKRVTLPGAGHLGERDVYVPVAASDEGSRPPWDRPATAASAWRSCPAPTTACACPPPVAS